MGAIALPVTVGQGAPMVTTMTDFLIVKASSSYNAILRRQTLNDLKVVTSTYHIKMKFPIKTCVGKVQGEQIPVWECYVQELKARVPSVCVAERLGGKLPPPLLVVACQDMKARDENNLMQAEANEPLEIVTLYPDRLNAIT